MSSPIAVGGPYFDELHCGQVFDTAPAVTLTDGMAAVHQSIVGSRLRLALDRTLSAAVVSGGTIAPPGLVTDVAIGQSTVVTHHVKANLFYRGLQFYRYPCIGDTLRTVTTVIGLRANTIREGRRPTGLVALRIVTVDQDNRPVLDFVRCAMLPLSDHVPSGYVPPNDDLAAIDAPEPEHSRSLDLAAFRRLVPGDHYSTTYDGTVWRSSGDVVSSAPELARLSLNIAATHHDWRIDGTRRLVYGGHTIGIAFSQAVRALPNIVVPVGWTSCDHTGPVHEGDTLTSELTVERTQDLDHGGLLHLRSVVHTHENLPVLDWRFSVLLA